MSRCIEVVVDGTPYRVQVPNDAKWSEEDHQAFAELVRYIAANPPPKGAGARPQHQGLCPLRYGRGACPPDCRCWCHLPLEHVEQGTEP